MLVDLKIMNSELGSLALASSLICDLMSNLIATIVSYGRLGLMNYTKVLMFHSSVLSISLVLFIVNNVGLNYDYGPFLLGLVVPDGPPLGSILMDRVPVKDSVALAFILSSQGVVQMSFYYYNSINQTLDGETFSMLTTSVLLQAIAANLIVKSLYDYSRMYTGYQKRDIQHTSYNSELRVLSCSLRADDVLAVRKTLETSYPTNESPLAVYDLHTVELVGRSDPQLIDHQLGQKSSGGTRTQKMIEILYSFEQQYSGAVTVQQFTTMSLTKFMHHDICSLAFNKLASLIILPFHRKWNHQEKYWIWPRVLFPFLLTATRLRRNNPTSSWNIGVAFFGGDDREALAYAGRRAQSKRVRLTVVQFVSWDIYAGDSQWDAVLDVEVLKDMTMKSAHQDNIIYREGRVKDGAETALLIHAMEEAFDLIMVGRRHKDDTPQLLGLNEWNDIPELGPIRDMLAAPDLSLHVSVLVMQHQTLKTKVRNVDS
ncbi:hypothetical protein BUALT_Bualt06G0066000 [Buddleja alternifolia]|uniref:Cation/H(+) antiporter C-terminal domain-containing protein n=1 Tax=Buddleja alternifolia TaxID=168488 RepID=A0AAV6XLL2_9LAMI|nr:hypothetical protein BUALT_Bualt06G0066000 [Buddleja alternifolia]